MANRKELVLVTTESGCIVPVSHRLNHDGYFRKQVCVDGKLRPMMYHRYRWELVHGRIPDGYEVDHLCKTRSCCNVEHLQLLLSTEHRTKDNKGRHSDKKAMAYGIWLQQNKSITGQALSELVGVSCSSACRWVREWKQ